MTNGKSNLAKADEAIDFLVKQDLCGPKIRIKVETALAVEKIESVAYSDGCLFDQLVSLVKLATSGKYADSISCRLIKCLIPRQLVPSSAVVIAISRICTNKLSISIKGWLIRWILIIFNLIDDLKDVHSLYGIFFLFLESDILCPHISLLLYYLTRREDVRHFRIKKLLDLQSRTGTKPHLTGLLSMYKMHCPNRVTMATSASNKKSWFKQSDRSWREAINNVQNKYNPQTSVGNFFLSAWHTEKVPLPKRRKPHGNNIAVHTAIMPEKKISTEQLSSFKDLLSNIDNVEFPNQVACVLNSPFLQHVLSCNPDFVMLQRLNFWLNHSLSEEFLTGSTSQTDISGLLLLEKLGHFTCFLQESIPAVEAFLVRYLFIWNGLDFRPLVLKFIAHLSLWPFQRLNDLILEHLRKLFFSSPVYVKCQVMYCFTELLRNFLAVEVPRQQELIEEERANRARDQASVSMFVEDRQVEPFDPLKTVYDLIQFVDRICVVGLQVEEDHTLLQHWVLNFFELVSTAHQQFSLPFVQIPSSGIIYRILFSDNSMAVSRLCQIIVNYKKEFESLKTSQGESQVTPSAFPDGFQSIQRLNQYILDICDSLWRNKAFIDRDKSFCFSMPSAVTDPLAVRHMNELFSIHHHVSLVGEAWRFLRQTQPGEMKLTPSLIKGRSRQAYLEYLRQRNLHGILDFLDTFIRPRT